MSEKKLDVSKNDHEGFQIEWRGILLTIRPNRDHGIFGSIAEKDGNKVKLLNFHGASKAAPFPVAFHEEDMPCEDSEPSDSPIVQAYEAIAEIRLAIPEDGSAKDSYQYDSLLDVQDTLWKMMTVEEQAGLDKEKPSGGRSGR